MSTCAGCGDCCAAITYRGTKRTEREWLAYWDAGGTEGAEQRNGGPEDSAFIVQHWKRISRAEAERRRPSLPPHATGMHYWVCDQFDYETRRCLAYATRPPVCQDFPWYGEEPAGERLIGLPRCSYWHEVPRSEWPKGTIPLRPVREALRTDGPLPPCCRKRQSTSPSGSACRAVGPGSDPTGAGCA